MVSTLGRHVHDVLSGRGSRLSPCASVYRRVISNNSYAHDEQDVNSRQVRGFEGVFYKLWPLLMPWLAATRCQPRWRESQSRQKRLSPLARCWRSVSQVARCWRSAGQDQHCLSTSPSLARLQAMTRGGMLIEIPDKLLTPTVSSSTLHNAYIHCTLLPTPLLSLGWRIGPI